MQPYQERVVEEKRELDEKLAKLREFIVGEAFASVDENEQVRLKAQESAMTVYSSILGDRISNFKEEG